MLRVLSLLQVEDTLQYRVKMTLLSIHTLSTKILNLVKQLTLFGPLIRILKILTRMHAELIMVL